MDTPSLPVLVLTVLGALIAVLALFAGGGLGFVATGLGAVAAAGVIHAIENRPR